MKRITIVDAVMFLMAIVIFLVLSYGYGFAGSAYVTETIASGPVTGGTFSDQLSPVARNDATNDLNVSIYGASWSGTVTLQRSFSDDAAWYDVKTWTANAQERLIDTERSTRYRIGVKQGEYSSGSVAVRLSK